VKKNMADIVTDQKDITICIVEDGDVTVENLVYPKYAKSGDQITINYSIKNTRGDVTSCYTSIEDADGNEFTRWDGTLNENETHPVSYTMTAPDTNLVLKIKAGYTYV
jgi:hypothetical protein